LEQLEIEAANLEAAGALSFAIEERVRAIRRNIDELRLRLEHRVRNRTGCTCVLITSSRDMLR
jgi:hypothetical protein